MKEENGVLADLFKDLQKVENFLGELGSLDMSKIGDLSEELTKEFDEIENLKDKYEKTLDKIEDEEDLDSKE
tara:strand:- start:61 stop:276 length:216 start_codon:yes stop_codon:yes gene_type:complete